MEPDELVFSNSKLYKTIAEKRSVGFEFIEKALEIVLKFIIDKKRIVYGGMCLDLALKSAGQPGIYSDDTLPDYDYMTPDFYNESNELANILYEAGLPNISAINASHFSSRRVRVNFFPVADLSYIPDNIYQKLPYIIIGDKVKSIRQYKGLRILHPDFQRNDLHRSFNIPFSNPPMEVILHRLEKDQKRFRLLNSVYPIEMNTELLKKNNPKSENIKIIEIQAQKEYFNSGVIAGIFNYGLLVKFIELLINPGISQIYTYLENSGTLDLIYQLWEQIIYFKTEIQNDKIILGLPESFKKINFITIVSDFPLDVAEKIKNKNKNIITTYFNKYLDNLRPKTILLENEIYKYELFDNHGELLPCYNLQKTVNIIKKLLKSDKEINIEEYDNIYLAQPNHLLLYFLQKSFELEDQKEIYQTLYRSTLNLIEISEKIHLSLKEENPEILEKIYKYLPFFFSIHTYGDFNQSVDYLASLKDKKAFLGLIQEREALRPPFGYYPESKEELTVQTWIPFDPDSSELFQINGLARLDFPTHI